MKTFKGKVISDRMIKAVTVLVERKYRHPLYGKILTSKRKIHANNELGAQVGQLVRITETRPFSRTISFKVTEILSPDAEPVKAKKVAGKKREVKEK
ncbi:MAG TPA: 30S ribosomal protein S17 [Patescibacteria group bacterium]|nr:30S ribosomal protein S17 [Patescibacteria group bacterium]